MSEIPLRWYKRPPISRLLNVLGVGLGVLLSAFVGVLVLRYRAYSIPAGSMEPTLRIGDHIMVDTWAYWKKSPQRGDVIVFRSPENPSLDLVKRCVAVGGDTVTIQDKRLSVNGRQLDERTYTQHLDPQVYRDDSLTPFGKRDQLFASKVPANSCFCLGDNRDQSYDSRFWGSVSDALLKGKVLYVYWSKDRSRIGKQIL